MGLDRVVTGMNLMGDVRRRSLITAGLTAAGILLLCAGCDTKHTGTASATPEPNLTHTSAMRDVPASGPQTEAAGPAAFVTTGPLVAAQQADVSAERDGRIVKIAAQIGDRVKKGQLLAQLDDRELLAQQDQQKAKLASARSKVTAWEAEQKADEADLHRADIMRKEKIISEQNWEHVKYTLDEVNAQLNQTRDDEAEAKAALNAIAVQLDQCRIVAPFDGVVGRSSVRPVQQVKAGDVLFWVTAERPLHVLFTVPETAMSAFTVGKRLELSTADYPSLRQEARIVRVSPVVDPASGSVQVVGEVQRPSSLLKPGMSMQVKLAP